MNESFETVQEAYEWMEFHVDDPCTDNYRFAFLDDDEALAKYWDSQQSGCCGFFDREIVVAGRAALIGCNYGH